MGSVVSTIVDVVTAPLTGITSLLSPKAPTQSTPTQFSQSPFIPPSLSQAPAAVPATPSFYAPRIAEAANSVQRGGILSSTTSAGNLSAPATKGNKRLLGE